jgi:hypothetical protein
MQRKWLKDIVFNNRVEAKEAVVKENQWSHHYSNRTAEGKKKYFRCNKVKFRGKHCPAFFKKFMCKYVLGMAIRTNYCRPPPAAKDVKIGEKRIRGRPAKSKKALPIQYIFVTDNYTISTEKHLIKY